MYKWTLAAMVVLGGVGFASAQSYPNRTVKIVVPFPAGSATDQVARVIAQQLQEILGQPFVVDNKAGGLASIGSAEVARSAPDGYTLGVATNTTHAANVALFKVLSYDPIRDFTPIIRTTTVPMVLVVRSEFPAQSVKEFVDLARAKPGQLTGGFYSAGSQVAVAKLKSVAKFTALDVPYKGSPATVTDLIGGHIAFSIVDLTVALPLIKGGKMKGLGLTSLRRLPNAPDIAPIADDFPGFEVFVWHGLVAPAGTPQDVVSRLHEATVKALARAETRDRLARLDLSIDPMNPEQFARFIQSEVVKWTKEVKDAGIDPQ